jgi:hypothetical protein
MTSLRWPVQILGICLYNDLQSGVRFDVAVRRVLKRKFRTSVVYIQRADKSPSQDPNVLKKRHFEVAIEKCYKVQNCSLFL